MALNIRTKKGKAKAGPKTPFQQVESHFAVMLTQALKENDGKLGDSLAQAMQNVPNAAVALDNSTPVLVVEDGTTNYSTSLNGQISQAVVAKAARASGVKGLTVKSVEKALETVSLDAVLEGAEADVNIFNAYIDVGDRSKGVAIDARSSDGRGLVMSGGEVLLSDQKTDITFRYAPNNGDLQYTPDWEKEDIPSQLQELFSNLSYEQFILIVAYAGFILSHPRADGLTFPILYLHGNAGSGKTTVARLIAMLLGLNGTKVKTQPKDIRDLIATASHNYMLCFDNCGRMSDDLANAMCSVATGGTVDGRKLYTNVDLVETLLLQPMILTAIKFPKQYDLCTRSIFIKAGVPQITYASDTEIYQKLSSILPQAQSWLLSMTAKAMVVMDDVESIAKFRGGDFNTFLAAFETVLGITDQSVQKYVNKAQEEALNMQALEHDELLASIISIVHQHNSFSGGPTAVHKMLHTAIMSDMRRLPSNWPQNASALSTKLNRMKEQLEKHGIEVISGGARGTHGRKLTLRAIDKAQNVEGATPVASLSEPVLIGAEQHNNFVEELPEPILPDIGADFDPLDDSEMDRLMEEYEHEASKFDSAPKWHEMTQAESDAATSAFLG
ncbi:hypothetical protein AB4320_21180 [Vibrio splendidus]